MASASTWSTRISSSESSSACMTRATSKAPALVSRTFAASSRAMAVASGRKLNWTKALLSISLYRKLRRMPPLKRILLAEDSPQDVEMTLNAMEEFHLANEVVVVSNGAEALDYLYNRGKHANHPNGLPVVVLLDLKMPKVDGLEVLRQMKSDPVLKKIPVVMVTSSREEQDLVKSYELGVNAYVVKPVDFQKFVESIRQIGFFWALINEPPPASVKKRE